MLRTFKPSETELPKLQEAAKLLKKSKAEISASERTKEAAEKALYDWLNKERGLDVATLEIGDFVNIDGVLILEIGSMNKFDQQRFQIEHPDLFNKFKRDVPVKRPKPIA